METNNNVIPIPGRLHVVSTDGVGLGAYEIFDDAKGKRQSMVNAETDTRLDEQDNKIDALEKQDVVPVDVLPSVSSADPKKIYRVVGETSYTDFMVNAAGDDWKELASFTFPGIDDEPTAGSDNLVKSGGVACIIGNSPIMLLNGYIRTANATVNPSEVIQHDSYKHAIIPCKPDDKFIINASTSGSSNLSVYVFCDINNNVLVRSKTNYNCTNLSIVAPEGVSYCVINSNNNETSFFSKKNSLYLSKEDKATAKQLSEYAYIYPEFNATIGIYPDDTSDASRAFIKIEINRSAKSLFTNIIGSYKFLIKQSLANDRVISQETEYSTGSHEVNIVHNAKYIVIYLAKIDGTSFTNDDITFLNTHSEILFKKYKNKEETNSNAISIIENIIGNKYYYIPYDIYRGRYNDDGSVSLESNRIFVKLTELSGFERFFIDIPSGYKMSVKWINNDSTVTEKDTQFRKNKYQFVDTKGYSSLAIIIAKIDDTANITAEDIIAMNINILFNHNMSQLRPFDATPQLGYVNEDGGSIDIEMDYRASIKIQNVNSYSQLSYYIPAGYYASFKFFDGLWICREKTSVWSSGEGVIETLGYPNIVLNIGKGTSHSEVMTQAELNTVMFSLLLTNSEPKNNIYSSVKQLDDSISELFNIQSFLYDYGDKLNYDGNEYSITSDITYQKRIYSPIYEALQINMLCSSNSEKTIICKYNGVRAVNDVVIENTELQFVNILMPPLVECGLIEILLPAGLKFKSMSINRCEPKKKDSNIYVYGHLGAYYGENNIPSFELCAKMGHDGCISNIMTTSDEVLVCSHDNSFKATSDGNTYNISDLTYQQINELGWVGRTQSRSVGWYKFFGGTKLPKIEDFVAICAVYGMTPVLSIDPHYEPNWLNLKTIFDRYGFNNKADIVFKGKGNSISMLQSAYNVFGNTVIYISSDAQQTQAALDAMIAADFGDSIKGFEAWAVMSDELIAKAQLNGIEVFIYESIFENPSQTFPYLTTKDIKDYIKKGVKYFTTDGWYGKNINL